MLRDIHSLSVKRNRDISVLLHLCYTYLEEGERERERSVERERERERERELFLAKTYRSLLNVARYIFCLFLLLSL